MNEHEPASTFRYRCFRCQSGCIHLICGNASLTLTRAQFLHLADTINVTRSLVLKDGEPTAETAYASNMIM